MQLTGIDEAVGRCCLSGLQVLSALQLTLLFVLTDHLYSAQHPAQLVHRR